ncbi:MAG: factor-independent urate hydroxylase [Gemmatimonadaceae bacterium]
MTRLGDNAYGKSRVRLVKVSRREGRHELRDLTVAIRVEGEFEDAHVRGDNRDVLPTDTMKNTVYALARQLEIDTIEEFGRALATHFLPENPVMTRARVTVRERPWGRIAMHGRPHPHAFVRQSGETHLATVTAEGDAVRTESGIDDLWVLKTTGSGFAGFHRDRFTTLRDTDDRVLASAMRVRWTYGLSEISYGESRERAREAIIATFAEHESRSVQHTAYAMGEAVLQRCPEIDAVAFSMPNKHHLVVDLAPLGLDNPNEVFVATDEPYGLIEAIVRR